MTKTPDGIEAIEGPQPERRRGKADGRQQLRDVRDGPMVGKGIDKHGALNCAALDAQRSQLLRQPGSAFERLLQNIRCATRLCRHEGGVHLRLEAQGQGDNRLGGAEGGASLLNRFLKAFRILPDQGRESLARRIDRRHGRAKRCRESIGPAGPQRSPFWGS